MNRTRMPRPRRGFNLVEMLLALAITASVMAGSLAALKASFYAYQTTTEAASTITVSRLAMARMTTLLRTGQAFGPTPAPPDYDLVFASPNIAFLTPNGDSVWIQWVQAGSENSTFPVPNALYAIYNSGAPQLLLGGVVPQYDASSNQILPFTLEYGTDNQLRRATIDLVIEPDDDQSVEIEGDHNQQIHLVSTTMPRIIAYGLP